MTIEKPTWLRKLPVGLLQNKIRNLNYLTLNPEIPKNIREIPLRFWFEDWHGGQKRLRVVITDSFFNFDEKQTKDILCFLKKMAISTKNVAEFSYQISPENIDKHLGT